MMNIDLQLCTGTESQFQFSIQTTSAEINRPGEHINMLWYFDVISPFAYLQLQRINEVREYGSVQPVPVAFGAILAHCGQLGPAEIPKKREFAYRFVNFQASALGFPIQFPPTHPFNPLPALRLICALPDALKWQATHRIFEHIWRDGQAGDSAESLAKIAAEFAIENFEEVIASDLVKQTLKTNTEQAINAGVFGVPTLNIHSELFWGFDATDYALAYLRNPEILSSPEAKRLIALPASVHRKR